MKTFDLNRAFEGPCSSGVLPDSRDSWTLSMMLEFGGSQALLELLPILDLMSVEWVAKIWKPFVDVVDVVVEVGVYRTHWEAVQAYMSSVEESAVEEITKEMKAVFGRAFFGKNDGSISSFQMLLVLENFDDIVSCERFIGIDEAAKTIDQIYGDAHLAAMNQRIKNPGTYPSWQDCIDYEAVEAVMELIYGNAHLAAMNQRIRNSRTYPSWTDYVDYEAVEAVMELIYGNAHLAAVIQRIRNSRTYPSWKDYGATMGLIYRDARLAAKIQRSNIVPSWKVYGATTALIYRDAQLAAEIQHNSIPAPNPSLFKDFPLYEECEAYKIFREKSSIANTRAHMKRESGGFVGGKRPGDTRSAEYMKQIPSEFSYHRYCTGPDSDHDAGIQNSTDISKIICEGSVRTPLLLDHAVQPRLADTFLLNVNPPIRERWTDVGSTMSRTIRNVLKKIWSMQSGGPNIVSNGIDFFKSASKIAVCMLVIGNTSAVIAVRTMAPEAVQPGSMQAEDFEKSSNFAFGIVACVGTLVTIIALVKSVNCRRRHAIAGTSPAIAPTGTILNRVGTMGQTLTVIRSWREIEFREVVVARREEEGAYAS